MEDPREHEGEYEREYYPLHGRHVCPICKGRDRVCCYRCDGCSVLMALFFVGVLVAMVFLHYTTVTP